MAAAIAGHPKGTVTWVYTTSDDGLTTSLVVRNTPWTELANEPPTA
ncbi:MAG: hypothetical protein IPJ34_04875 [Myxococcales bacterium]|nr:hypothetical protein [Myxococcales bacterium]